MRLQQFSKTATAAKMSGTFNETIEFFKHTLGGLTDDSQLKDSGRNQQLLGKIHRLVGSLRSVREEAFGKFNSPRIECQALCRKHGGRILDVASDFVDDMKKALLK